MTVALVTGITGQDGSYLLERLLADGLEVHGIVRAGTELPPEVIEAHPQVELHHGDLTDGQRLAVLVHEVAPDEIYNLGGLSSVALSWREPALTGAVNGVAVTHTCWKPPGNCRNPLAEESASSRPPAPRSSASPPPRHRTRTRPWRQPTPTERLRPTPITWWGCTVPADWPPPAASCSTTSPPPAAADVCHP
jgi:NAD(P)-dependent dehydrogenase (short-subunit alcohol dehydrogenase family)